MLSCQMRIVVFVEEPAKKYAERLFFIFRVHMLSTTIEESIFIFPGGKPQSGKVYGAC